VLPHAPQFLGWVAVSTQRAPHAVRPVGHAAAHVPAAQVSPAAHGVPQPPQFAGSASMSTHTPAHSV
jgi:hypothetical protein